MDTAKDIAQIIATVGFPACLVLLVLYAMWQAGTWLGTHAVEPVVVQLIHFISSANENLAKMSEAVDALKTAQAEQAAALKGAACRYPLPTINPPAPAPAR